MISSLIEPLEPRQFFSGSAAVFANAAAAPPMPAKAAKALRPVAPFVERTLTAAQVRTILGQAAAQARPTQAIVVVDREGNVLATYLGAALSGPGADPAVVANVVAEATVRARTAAYFQSNREAFTTRTARFIIQDHFPYPIANTPGGPLYGVQFSSLPGSDVAVNVPAVSGDPGGIPLYFRGSPVGGVGVSGDGHDIAAREDLLPADGSAPADNPNRAFFTGKEESDYDEAVALAGARGFMAPAGIRATQIFIDGLRLPFTQNKAAAGSPRRTLDSLVATGAGTLVGTVVDGRPSPYPKATFANFPGELKNPEAPNPFATAGQIVDSNDAQAVKLTAGDVEAIITNAVAQSRITRAGIRKPNGTAARVHVAVVDRDGDILGVFRMDDGTLFSYDVAVQKARTAAFFSDDAHAFSTRAVGFMAQRFFPPGIDRATTGPLFHLQNELSQPANLHAPLKDGITIFPGGFPLYKDGVLVGAIGVSGDGVDQDDLIAYAGTRAYRPSEGIRSDSLPKAQVIAHTLATLQRVQSLFTLDYDAVAFAQPRLVAGLEDGGFRLPYAKFPRNPLV
jgi:uncharacterized protein GlcG (DUF336 family)